MGIHVTQHAIDRFIQRVARVTRAEAVIALSSPAVHCADRFGAPFVRLGTGQRIVIHDHTVITVLPKDTSPASLDRRREICRRAA